MTQITQNTAVVEPAVEIALNEKTRSAVVTQLNIVLADTFVLAQKTRNYHWNVVGANFPTLHPFFNSQYVELNENVDEIAERIRSLGGTPASTLAEIIAISRIKEEVGKSPSAKEMLSQLLIDQESLIRTIRSDLVSITKLEDAGTVEFLTALLETQEKMAWTVRATAPPAQLVKA